MFKVGDIIRANFLEDNTAEVVQVADNHYKLKLEMKMGYRTIWVNKEAAYRLFYIDTN